MKTDSRRFLMFLLAGILMSGGCGNVAQEAAPTLSEPVAANFAYRPVEPGTVGDTKILYGTVAPVEYCCFFESPVEIEKIVVEVGDYVKEGDIVAYADIAMLGEQLEDMKQQLENMEQNYDLNMKISQLQIAQTATREVSGNDGYENMAGDTVSGGDAAGNKTGSTVSGSDLPDDTQEGIAVPPKENPLEKRRKIDVATGLENLRYDEMLYKYRVSKLQEAIEKQQKIFAEGVLRASHSGYVEYTKNLSEGTRAAAYENIAVIADPEETYIELPDRTTDKYTFRDYEVKYLMHQGKACAVTEWSYGTEAEVLAKARGMCPRVRLVCPEAGKLEIGRTYPIFYQEKKSKELPVIGWDSLKGEKDAYYVYVRTEDGQREKRFVTIGETDNYYAQVLEGLKVGEEVYYQSDTRLPADYVEYEVELSDYSITNYSDSYSLAGRQVTWYEAQCGGTVTEVLVRAGARVKAGDLLYVMKSDVRGAALAEAQNNINQENMTYEATIKRLYKSLETETNEYARKSLNFQIELENINHAYRLKQLEKTYRDMAENNNGDGDIRVYAKQSGTVANLLVSQNTPVTEGDHVLSIAGGEDDRLLVQMKLLKEIRNYPKNIADFGESVTIVAGNSVYQGACIGMTVNQDNNLDKYYLSTIEGDTVISFCTDSGYGNPAFYVRMEDKTFHQNMPKGGRVSFSYVAMEDVIVVPTALVQEEANARNPAKTDYFVWRIGDGRLIKQYVLINKAYSDVNETVILSGIKEHDILAREK